MQKIALYHLRFFAYCSLAATAMLSNYIGYFKQTTFIIILGLSVIPPCVDYLSSLKGRKYSDHLGLILLDATIASLVALLLGEHNIITLLFILVITFNTYLNSNARYTLLVLMILFCFITICSTLFEPHLESIQPPNIVIVICTLFTGCYFLACARYIQQNDLEKIKLRQTIAQQEKERQLAAQKLSKYLSPQVWESIFGIKKQERIETTRKKLTVFFSDIKDFTHLSEELEPEVLSSMLNHYLTEMSHIAQSYNGTIDKFIGDSIMIFFGDTNTMGVKKDAIAATTMALAMQSHMKNIRNYWTSRGITRHLEIRMGINTGYCTVGNFGASARMDYTIIGREVNLASRLENAARPGEILISEETYALIKDVILCRDKGEINAKGFSKPTQTYEVIGLRQELGANSYFIEHETKGFSLYLDSINILPDERANVVSLLEKTAEQLKK